VHLYLTVPFVLSWSLLEAMAAGCCIVSSRTPPVQEVLEDGENALLADFFDSAAQAAAIGCLLDDPQRRQRLGAAAQGAAHAYDADKGLASWRALLLVDAN
jgi:glycosyltransferase involved in cell wall biosynthesis